MPPKNRLSLEDRESNKSVVQRFMTTEVEEMAPEREETSPTPDSTDTSQQYTLSPKAIDDELKKNTSGKKLPLPKPKNVKNNNTNDKDTRKESRAKLNPFVQAMKKAEKGKSVGTPKFQVDEVDETENSEKLSDQSTLPREHRLPDVGENLRQYNNAPQPYEPRGTPIKIMENIVEVIEEVEEVGEAEELLSKTDEIPDTELIEDNLSQQNSNVQEIEIAEQIQKPEQPDINMSMSDVPFDEPAAGSDKPFEVSPIFKSFDDEQTDNISDTADTLATPDAAEPATSTAKNSTPGYADYIFPDFTEVKIVNNIEEADIIVNKTVIKKVLKRAYDSEEPGIASYARTLENGDSKSRLYFKNTLEDSVVEEVEAAVKRIKNMCKCDRCLSDICAIVLNSLKPHYVTTALGELYDRASLLNIENLTKISTEVFRAIDIVRYKPSHK